MSVKMPRTKEYKSTSQNIFLVIYNRTQLVNLQKFIIFFIIGHKYILLSGLVQLFRLFLKAKLFQVSSKANTQLPIMKHVFFADALYSSAI